MMITTETVTIPGDTGAIHAVVCAPRTTDAALLPHVLLYADIFQLTPSHLRLAQRLAGHGFVVVSPDLYGRLEPPGTVFDFEADRARALSASDRVTVDDLDADRRAVLAWMKARKGATPVLCAGWCFGGHLAFRAAMEPEVAATVCFYGTGIHNGKLGASADAGSLARAAQIHGELLLVWGRQDPHIPADGRARIHRALDDAGVRWRACLVDAEHAFMRDVGPRFDPEATDRAFAEMLTLFRDVLRAAARNVTSPG